MAMTKEQAVALAMARRRKASREQVDEPQKSTDESVTEAMLEKNPSISALRKILARQSPGSNAFRRITDSLNAEIQNTIKQEEFRRSNPELAKVADETPEWKKNLIGIGRGMADIGRGLGIAGEESEAEKLALQAVEDQSSAGRWSRSLGQAAPFLPLAGLSAYAAPAITATAGPALGGAINTAGYSALGGSEGYLSSVGEGKDPTIPTLVGAGVPVAGPLASKAISGVSSVIRGAASKSEDISNILKSAAKSDTVDQISAISKKGGDDQTIKMLESIPENETHITALKVKNAIEAGATGDDVAKILRDQKLKATEGAGARYKLKGSGYTSDKKSKELIRQGMQENDVQLISSSSKADKAAYKKIAFRAGEGLKSSAKKADMPPQAVVGESLLERLRAVESINKTAGSKIDGIAKKVGRVELNDAFYNFKKGLDNLGVKFRDGNADFEGSALMDLEDLQNPILKIIKRLDPARNKNVTGYDAHILKKWFDKQINYGGGKAGVAVDKDVERLISGLRADVNKAIGIKSPEYKRVNTEYSESIGAINDLRSIAGRKTNLFGDYADESLGALSRRVTSNATSRGAVLEAIKNLEDVSAKYGEVFDSSVSNQVMFVNALEKKLGAFNDTSLMGQFQAPLQRASIGGGGEIGPMLDIGGKAIKGVVGKLKPKNDDAFLKAINDLIAE